MDLPPGNSFSMEIHQHSHTAEWSIHIGRGQLSGVLGVLCGLLLRDMLVPGVGRSISVSVVRSESRDRKFCLQTYSLHSGVFVLTLLNSMSLAWTLFALVLVAGNAYRAYSGNAYRAYSACHIASLDKLWLTQWKKCCHLFPLEIHALMTCCPHGPHVLSSEKTGFKNSFCLICRSVESTAKTFRKTNTRAFPLQTGRKGGSGWARPLLWDHEERYQSLGLSVDDTSWMSIL